MDFLIHEIQSIFTFSFWFQFFVIGVFFKYYLRNKAGKIAEKELDSIPEKVRHYISIWKQEWKQVREATASKTAL